MAEQALIPPLGYPVRLTDYDPEYAGSMSKEEAAERTEEYKARIAQRQEVLYAQGKYSLLVIFQAMDAAGKDSAIRHVFSGVNPQGIRVANFKAPAAHELAHDFLWRVHAQVPPRGMIGVFNRSHYEDVLIVRVNQLVPEDVWRKRYDHINAFERLLHDSGTHILKFYLHISKDEQKKQLQERLNDPSKHWKFSIGDLPVRQQWDEYMRAYEDVFARCSTLYAPWHIVPANKRWYRTYVIAKTIAEALDAMPLRYPEPEPGLDQVVIAD
ncbi:MAG: polyphosphate kinase 2 family protein [Anaerolineae bacterium]|nr:polyphosphate kinase 2 family protein [Anaerolineae bacterium]MDW8173140.1 polyphosphate kinase 2 family protein [Anaerolineae bacterium]